MTIRAPPPSPSKSPPKQTDPIVTLLGEYPLKRRSLQQHAQKLASNHRKHPETLGHLLSLDLGGKSGEEVGVYKDLVILVASLSPASSRSILESLIGRVVGHGQGRFGKKNENINNTENSSNSESNKKGNSIKRGILKPVNLAEYSIDEWVVETLCSVSKIVPASQQYLQQFLRQNFPFYYRSFSEHMTYLSFLLSLSTSIPRYRPFILELIISKSLLIDVELQNDHALLKRLEACETGYTSVEEERGDDILALLADLDQESEEAKRLRLHQERRLVKDGVRKLDAILKSLFIHITNYIYGDNSAESLTESESVRILEGASKQRADEMFILVLGIFERVILPTFKSRYLQYLMFYMASLCPELSDQFLGVLFRPLLKFCSGLDHGRRTQPSPTLLMSVAYIGSYVSRARLLSNELLKMSFDMLLDLGSRLIVKGSSSISEILTVLVLQHLMYIFIWQGPRVVALYGIDELSEIFNALFASSAQTILPLCNKSITSAFLSKACAMNLLPLSVLSEWEQKKRIVDGVGRPLSDELENYFPFEPMLCLRNARSFISADIFQHSPLEHSMSVSEEADHETKSTAKKVKTN